MRGCKCSGRRPLHSIKVHTGFVLRAQPSIRPCFLSRAINGPAVDRPCRAVAMLVIFPRGGLKASAAILNLHSHINPPTSNFRLRLAPTRSSISFFYSSDAGPPVTSISPLQPTYQRVCVHTYLPMPQHICSFIPFFHRKSSGWVTQLLGNSISIICFI